MTLHGYLSDCCRALCLYVIDDEYPEGETICAECGEPCREIEVPDKDEIAIVKAERRGR